MLNVPVPLIGVSVGAPVRVNGPALAPVAVFLTVTVPSLGVLPPVFKPVVVNVTVAPMTLNELFRVTVPPGVVTLTFRCPQSGAARNRERGRYGRTVHDNDVADGNVGTRNGHR